ncbi:glutathione S-transferase family protein [Pseudoalteromonas sp. JBTF-M23]|uniref:Glutathione S-transferase family protein n=1 Tax=Pseudoalteromonas caenipelagi TaxID=2726988 RepID=A0A849VH61_9GAMM|nr:glutathione S-transferase family protein [Pseudoalteromonas caenipelagi]NOU51027.1 glutathione S-transferase family protein [Pseudoalteromonas caenipelagi]
MKLYTHPWSNHAARVHILLNELGLDYQAHAVELMEENLKPEYLQMNPNGKVPVLDDNSFIIWESHAILRYISDKYDDGKYYPNNKQRYLVDQWLDWNHTRLNVEAITINFNNVVLGEEGDQQAVTAAKEEALNLLTILDQALSGKNFICDEFSIADISLFTSVVYLNENKVDFSQLRNVQRWFDAINQRASVKAPLEGIKEAY